MNIMNNLIQQCLIRVNWSKYSSKAVFHPINPSTVHNKIKQY